MSRRLSIFILLLSFNRFLFAGDTTRGLSLAECLRIAEENHPDLIESEALVRAAEAQLRGMHAAYLPRIDLGGSYIRETYNYSGIPGTPPRLVNLFSRPQSSSNAPYYYAGLDVSQTIYDFGHTKSAVRRGEAELEASRDNLRRVRDLVDLNVRSAYYGVLAAQELVRVRTEAVNNQSKHLEQARAFYEVGRRPKIDVTKQEVALANAQVDLRQAQEDLVVAKAALATSMGLPLDQVPEPLKTLEQRPENQSLSQLLADAEQHRPDVQSLRDAVDAAQADIIAARSNFRPTLALSSFFNYRNLKFPLVYNWSIGEIVAQNLFAGGADRALLAQDQAQLEAVQASLRSLIQRVRQEAFIAFSDLRLAQDKIGLAIKAEGEAKENLDLAEGRYQAGYGNVIELTDAQLVSTQSQVQEITARYDYQIAAARLDTAVGRKPK